MKNLCVVFGGASTEHDISIITGMQLAKNLKPKYNLVKIYFGLDNKFYLADKAEDIAFFKDKQKLNLKAVIFYDGAVYLEHKFKKLFDVECVINCCHGGLGENGDLSAHFNLNKIKCTSASALASHIAMDKHLAKELVKDIVPTVKGILVTRKNLEDATKIINKKFSKNLIVKPNSLGSSIGVKACDKSNYIDQINAIFELNDNALVEERVVDILEYNQACFKDGENLVLSVIENPITKSNFLTFDDKYMHKSGKGEDRIIPADISPELEEQIIDYTSKIYTALNMNGLVRIDYILDKSTNTLYFNEINTIPGSMAFYLYEPLGIDYITLIERQIDNSPEIQKFAYFKTDVLNKKI